MCSGTLLGRGSPPSTRLDGWISSLQTGLNLNIAIIYNNMAAVAQSGMYMNMNMNICIDI